jgi:O-antigen biosynthesis protein
VKSQNIIPGQLDHNSTAIAAEVDALRGDLALTQSALAIKDTEMRRLKARLSRRDRSLRERTRKLAEYADEANELGLRLNSLDAQLAVHRAEAARLALEVAARDEELAARAAEVERLAEALAVRDEAIATGSLPPGDFASRRLGGLDAELAVHRAEAARLTLEVAARDEALAARAAEVERLAEALAVRDEAIATSSAQALIAERDGTYAPGNLSLWRRWFIKKRRLRSPVAVTIEGWRSVSQFASWLFRRPSRERFRLGTTYLALRAARVFDDAFYLAKYPDVAEAHLNPLMHYIEHGAREGRDPHPLFDTSRYTLEHPDVLATGENPLLHCVREHSRASTGNAALARASAASTASAATSPTSVEYAPPATTSTLEDERAYAAATEVGTTAAPIEPLAGVEPLLRARLDDFLRNGRTLAFPSIETPSVSVVIPTFGQPHFVLAALESLLATAAEHPFEVIVVDNGSGRETRTLLAKLKNVTVHFNTENLGFGHACNQGVSLSKAPRVCFLNSDTLVTPGWLQTMSETLDSYEGCAAVGAKLVHPNGRLQEAGGIIWSDGSNWGYGRGADPLSPEFQHRREVDYCSAACLLVARKAFLEVGAFDSRYAPAYYEDADLCMALRAASYCVVYEPRATIFHMEFASGGSERALALQLRNREEFRAKWTTSLAAVAPPKPEHVPRRRDARAGRRVLVIDDRVPAPALGSGLPRTRALLSALASEGYVVTYFPTAERDPDLETAIELRSNGIELVGGLDFEGMLAERAGLYDAVFVSRPHNARLIAPARHFNPRAVILYDAEAVFSLREALQARIGGVALSEQEVHDLVEAEIALAADATFVITVSEREAEFFRARRPHNSVGVWGTATRIRSNTPPFAVRSGLLFIGNLATSPNADAILYFLNQVFPRLRERLACHLTIVGAGASPPIRAAAARFPEEVALPGFVQNLAETYDLARVFVAPHRFAGGVPLKVIEAMANGVPCVVSPLLAEQLGVKEGTHVLVAGDQEDTVRKITRLHGDEALWRELQIAALEHVASRYDPDAMRRRLKTFVERSLAESGSTSGVERVAG